MTKDELEELDDEELVEMWNKFCENTNMFDDTVYPMAELEIGRASCRERV